MENLDAKLPSSALKMKHKWESKEAGQKNLSATRDLIGNLMWDKVGIVRSAETLKEALVDLRKYKDLRPAMRSGFELQNMLEVSMLVTDAALVRQESRGAHYRSDYPDLDDVIWHRHITFQKTNTD